MSRDSANDELMAVKHMELRDWFAGQVLAGCVSHPDTKCGRSDPTAFHRALAEGCYRIADAMMAARNATEPSDKP